MSHIHFYVYSRKAIKNHKLKELVENENIPSFLIRIVDPEDFSDDVGFEVCEAKSFASISKHVFHDIESPILGSSSILYSDKQHQDILSFFKDRVLAQPECNVVIHCHAGVSRSAAVAYGLLQVAKDKGKKTSWYSENRLIPNQLVLSFFNNAKESIVASDYPELESPSKTLNLRVRSTLKNAERQSKTKSATYKDLRFVLDDFFYGPNREDLAATMDEELIYDYLLHFR